MPNQTQTSLRRALSLPWLVFYGVGVTVGAGVFALIGDVVAVAGDHAALAFLIAGIVAGFTGFSYAALASAYPRAAGEAIFVKYGLGEIAGRIVGLGVLAVAVTSSAVIGLAFAGYVEAFTGWPDTLSLIGIMLALAIIAWIGVKESIAFAALITVLEVGTLLVVSVAGLAAVDDPAAIVKTLVLPGEWPAWMGIMSGAFLAFFAFIGFEDIENMAEETQNPSAAIPAAIILTLVISVAIYMLVAIVAVAFPDRAALATSKSPLVLIFERGSGMPGQTIAAMAAIAMINGILVQIVMASRVIYGMAREGMLPAALATVDSKRQTPLRAIALVAAAALTLALSFPLLRLAELTSLFMLCVFTVVNLSLYLIGRREEAPAVLRRWRFWGLGGSVVSFALVAAELVA